jgi:2-polyprenyl-3-methyl-5-hydroxy-6-metoxy-1,4-benzoquinol methylase
MTSPKVDNTKAELFGKRMFEIVNSGSISLMISIGHRTGLFDIMAKLPASTSDQIARASGLNERYVREWLGAMVTGRIVDYDPINCTYYLPPEHSAFLTRAAAQNNVAAILQLVPLLGSVEDKIVESFLNGGGVPYSAFPRFHQVMAEVSAQTIDIALINTILPLVPGLIESLHSGIEVLDIGCGSGHAINVMAEAFPKSRFTGYDFAEEAIAAALAEAEQKGLKNVRFEVKDVSRLDEQGRYAFITAFDAIHDQVHPDRVLRGIANALKADGLFLMQDINGSSHVHKDIDHPLGAYLYTVSCMHCMTVSLAHDGEGLGTMWGEEKARKMLADAGFRKVELKSLPEDLINFYYIATKN